MPISPLSGRRFSGHCAASMQVRVLVSPLAKGAYFADYLDVAVAELALVAPQAPAPRVERIADLDFLQLELNEESRAAVARASFVQGLFEVDGDGRMRALDIGPKLAFPETLVFGAKYQGKTNELVTQLAVNAALRFCRRPQGPHTLFDPMAGKGTSLLWAVRYGMNARGIEIDGGALDALHRHIKRQTKLHRIKHRHNAGFVGAKSRDGRGRFVRYEIDGRALQLITGDSQDAAALLGAERFDAIVTDLPYGIQFKGKGPKASILDTVKACAPAWVARMRDGGSLVLIFNRYQPKRDALADVFVQLGCRLESFEAPHRMSESIVRDLVVLTTPEGRGSTGEASGSRS